MLFCENIVFDEVALPFMAWRLSGNLIIQCGM